MCVFISDEPANDTEQNGGDVLNDSADLNEEIDQVLNAVAEDGQMESEPIVEPQEEVGLLGTVFPDA